MAMFEGWALFIGRYLLGTGLWSGSCMSDFECLMLDDQLLVV